MAKTKWLKGEPIDAPTQEKLRELIRKLGEDEVARAIGISEGSVIKAAAGARLRKVTIAAIRSGIATLAL